MKNLAEELRMDIVEKDTHLDHLQKQNEELRSSLSQSKLKDEAIKDFKSSKEFIDLCDANYVASFEDFRMDALEFPEVDFDHIKLCTIAEISLLQKSSGDLNIKDDASTPLPTKDGSKSCGDAPSGLSL